MRTTTMMAWSYSTAVIASLAIVVSRCYSAQSLVVGNSQQRHISGRSFSTTTQRRSRSMTMYIDDMMPMTSMGIPPFLPLVPDSPSVASGPSNMFSATSKLIASDPHLEVEILNDASVALDVSTFFSPDTVWLRLCNVIGRILILSEGYIQHNDDSSFEWAFQVSMLAISCHMFAKSAWPIMVATLSISKLTVRDRRAYTLLFRALGISILQFKTLLASRSLEWVEYEPGKLVELGGEYMYFLYSGEAVILAAADAIITESTNSSGRGGKGLRISRRIFGDTQFAKALDASLYKKSKNRSKSYKTSMGATGQATYDSTTNPPQGSFIVGRGGSTMLRISTPKLLQLMENDDQLSKSIQSLILLCMEEKMNKSFEHDDLKMSFKKNVFDFQSGHSSLNSPVATHTSSSHS